MHRTPESHQPSREETPVSPVPVTPTETAALVKALTSAEAAASPEQLRHRLEQRGDMILQCIEHGSTPAADATQPDPYDWSQYDPFADLALPTELSTPSTPGDAAVAPGWSDWNLSAEDIEREKREYEELQAEFEREYAARKERERQQELEKQRAQEEAEFLDAMRDYRRGTGNRPAQHRGERAQELSERAFNAAFSTLEEIEAAAAAGDVSVTTSTEQYQGQTIPVYNFSGYPLRFLQHTVDYKLSGNNDAAEGRNTAKQLISDPSLWLRPATTVSERYEGVNHKSNAISGSYVDVEQNINNGAPESLRGVAYGFLSLQPGSLVGTYPTDGGTRPTADLDHLRTDNFVDYTPDQLARRGGHGFFRYNEVRWSRYDESGHPTPPDFLVTYDGHITDDTRRHAAYFGVPIINIESRPYLDRQREAITKQLEALDDQSPYEDIHRAIQSVRYSSLGVPEDCLWKTDIFAPYTDQYRDDLFSHYFRGVPLPVRAKFIDLMDRIEPAKRLEMLDAQMHSEIAHPSPRRSYRPPFRFHTKQIMKTSPDGQQHGPYDALSIEYDYNTGDGEVTAITTQIDETSPGYEYFRELSRQVDAAREQADHPTPEQNA